MNTHINQNQGNEGNGGNDRMPRIPNDEFGAAYDRRLAEILAVKEDAFTALNLDVHAAVATVLGTVPKVRLLRDEIGKLVNLDLALVDGLEEYAEAAGEAHSRWVTATTPGEEIATMNEQAIPLRETLRVDAMALAHRGLIDAARLKAMKNLTGFKNVGFDLLDYANLFLDCWQTIQGKTALTMEEIQKAKVLGQELVRAAGLREQGPAIIAEAARIRQQALTLLLGAYDEVRRAVHYLRWREDDADLIVPSLYAGRNRKRAGAAGDAAAPTEPAAPAANAAAVRPAAAPAAPAHTEPIAPGLPGANPFI